jgi:hypothetical protein
MHFQDKKLSKSKDSYHVEILVQSSYYMRLFKEFYEYRLNIHNEDICTKSEQNTQKN